MLLVDDLAAGGTKNLRHTPRGLVTLNVDNCYIAATLHKVVAGNLGYCSNLATLMDRRLV